MTIEGDTCKQSWGKEEKRRGGREEREEKRRGVNARGEEGKGGGASPGKTLAEEGKMERLDRERVLERDDVLLITPSIPK